MPAELHWSFQALRDLDDIYIAIGLDSQTAVDRMYSRLRKRAEQLVDFPRLAAARPEIAPTARCLVEGSYLLLYRLHPDTTDFPVKSVQIVRIVHARRDLSRVF